MRKIMAQMLGSFAGLCMLIGFALILSISGFSLTENGRLSESACYLILAGLFYMTYKLWRLDRAVESGRISPDTLPAWLR